METPAITLGYFSSKHREPRVSPYLSTPPPTVYKYTEIVNDAQSLANAYANVELDVIGQSFGGRNQYGLRIGDDGTKPVMMIFQGIHGNEIAPAHGLHYWLLELCKQETEESRMALASFAVFVSLTQNPDGMVQELRSNDNGVNLNRNFPLYWNSSTDTDKGTGPLSEPESDNVAKWMDLHNCTGRIVTALDIHGWSSRAEWGYLCEQHYYRSQSEWLQRISFLNYQHLVGQRDWSQYAWVDADPSKPKEFLSESRPYVNTYARMRGADLGHTVLWEYPVGEKTSVICTAILDVLDGLVLAHLDSIRPEVPATLLAPPVTRLNDNPFFTGWSSVNSRPSYYRKSGLDLSYSSTGGVNNQPYVLVDKPSKFPWAEERTAMAYAQTDNYRITLCGENGSAYNSDDEVKEAIGSSQSYLSANNFPVDAEWIAACAGPNDTVYVSGGVGDGSVYLDGVYEGVIVDESTPVTWNLIATLPAGLQRHSMEYINGKLYVVGGRLSGGYTDQVLEVDISTGTVANVGLLPQGARGYVSTGVIGSILFIFGGYNPTSGITGEVTTYDPSTGGFASVGSMPMPHRKMASVSDPVNGFIYLWGGDDDAYNVSSTVYEVNATGAFTEIVLEMSKQTNTDGSYTEIDKPFRSAGALFLAGTELLLVGGRDPAGTISDTVYVVQLEEGNQTYRRGKDSVSSYGWIRSNNVFYGVENDRLNLVAAIRSRGTAGLVLGKVPYIRLQLIVSGPGGLNDIRRRIRSWYTVPPRSSANEWGIFSVPVVLHAGEEQVRAYVRLYGDGTGVDLGSFQVYQSDVDHPDLLDDLTITAADSSIPFTGHGLNLQQSYSAVPLQGYFSPLFGANQENYVTAIEFTARNNPGDTVTGARLKYDSRWTVPDSTYLGAFDYVIEWATHSTWIFEVDFLDGSTLSSTVGAGELNHKRSSRLWRRDTVGWQLTTRESLEHELVLSIHWCSSYREMAITLPFGTVGQITGGTYQPVGILVPSSVLDRPYSQHSPLVLEGDTDSAGNVIASTPESFVQVNGVNLAVEGSALSNNDSIINDTSFIKINGKSAASFGSITNQGSTLIPVSGRSIMTLKSGK